MTTKAKMMETVTVSLDAKPGALNHVYQAFRESGVNVIASWGYEMGPGQAQAHFCATDTTLMMDILKKIGKTPKKESAVWVEGDDRVGVYAEVLSKVAKAGINIHATDALSIAGKFAAVFFTDDCNKLLKVLS